MILLTEAAGLAERLMVEGIQTASIDAGAIGRIELTTPQRLDRELMREPESYVGVTEIAEMLGVSKQRVSELRGREGFPAPIAEIAAGPVWRRSMLQRFLDTWERKPGRPRKDGGAHSTQIAAKTMRHSTGAGVKTGR